MRRDFKRLECFERLTRPTNRPATPRVILTRLAHLHIDLECKPDMPNAQNAKCGAKCQASVFKLHTRQT